MATAWIKYLKGLLLASCAFLFFQACVSEKGDIKVNWADQDRSPGSVSVAAPTVTSVSIVNHQLVISGSNLQNVTSVKVTGPSSFSENFSIETKAPSNLVANGLQAISFTIGQMFDLVLSGAYGAATFQVTFTLQDGAVTAAKLHDMGAADGDVLTYNQTMSVWEPRSLSSLSFQGTWNASTNVPTLADGGAVSNPSTGFFYVVGTSGSSTIDAISSWNAGDWILFNGTTWERVANSNGVVSFKGRQGAVTPAAGDYTWAEINKTLSSITDIGDVDTTSTPPVSGDVLKWNGANWVPGSDITGNAVGSVTSSAIADGTITDADINASAGISQSKISGLSTTLSNLTASSTANLASIGVLNGQMSTVSASTTANTVAINNKLGLTGGTLTGALNMSTSTISNVATPINTGDAANKGYVDGYVDASMNDIKQKTAGTFNRDTDSLEALRDQLDLLAASTTALQVAAGAYTWHSVSTSTSVALGHAYSVYGTTFPSFILPSTCSLGGKLQISSTGGALKIQTDGTDKIHLSGDTNTVLVVGLLTAELTCTVQDSRWTITSISGTGNVYPGDYPFCGGTGDSCYTNVAATTAGYAVSTLGVLEYSIAAGAFKVWKEKDGPRILKASGLAADGWQWELQPSGKSYSSTYFSNNSIIEGRACPEAVYRNDGDKFHTNTCLYYHIGHYTTRQLSQGGTDYINGFTTWSPEKWFVGNTDTCNSIGMRLPVLYETKAYVNGTSWYPTSDGSPGALDATKGIPSHTSGSTWTATAYGGGNTFYWTWSGTSQSAIQYSNSYYTRCVLP